ncbi:MAG TPA: type II secretion system protein [Planctomycetota bacterium]|nr:type II secretion system protein [Planctomycetota bacterium]
MRRLQSGFTLIELLIVISIISLLAAVLVPAVFGSQTAAFALADSANLRWHGQQLELYKLQNKRGLPIEGGHKFVLSTWTIVGKTEENFDRYFTPGRRDNDPDYRALRAQLERGEKVWEEVKNTNSQDTHYAGRAREHLQSATSGEDEAWMADDNEGVWSHADGTVNVLFNGGIVRSYSFLDMKSRGFVQGEFDKNNPIETTGPNSPIPECRKLAN